MQSTNQQPSVTTVPSQGKQTKPHSPQSGFALAITALVVAALLYYLNPDYLASPIVTKITSIFFGVVGTGGLGFELHSLSGKSKILGVDNIGIGVGFIGLWAILYHFSPGWFINVPILPILLFGTYGTVLGIIELLNSLLFNQQQNAQTPTPPSVKAILAKSFVGLVTMAGLTLTLLQIGQILKIIP